MKHLAWLSLAWLSQLLLFSGGAMAEERTISFKPGTEHVVLWRDFETMDAWYSVIK